MIVFGDSSSDTGRRFNAPASFQFEEYGIGPFPFKRLYDGSGTDTKTAAYMPIEGSVTNGKPWTTWLRIPDEHNFAASSATATSEFQSRQTCTGYSGVGLDNPTGTLEEQIDAYFNEILAQTTETLDYTHVIFIGSNDPGGAADAITRYSLGGEGYVDPVDFDNVFELDAETGLPVATFEPVIELVLKAWDDEIGRLIAAGVTGRILLANVGSPKGLAGFFGTPEAVVLDGVAQALSFGAQELVVKYAPQVRILDVYTLLAASQTDGLRRALVDEPSIFEDLGFTPGEGDDGLLAESCIQFDFFVDSTAEIMGTQAQRNPDCQEECALCADSVSPCQNCFVGTEPGITKCDDPSKRIFYDGIHFTTDFHLLFGEAVRQCSKDSPNFDRPLVEVLCPAEYTA
ncbi:unnamed protein product [Scytosiphon promiscuus]